MADDHRWTRLDVAGVRLDAPAEVQPAPGQGIDGEIAELEGAGLRVLLDRSLFADPLTGHRGKPGFSSWRELIAGAERDVVELTDGADGSALIATRLPGLTATVRVAAGADRAAALRILRSLQPEAAPGP